MAVTLTVNYRDTLNANTVEKIDELIEDNYCLDDILEFIDEYNEKALVEIYEEYVRCGEAIGYEAVDALACEDGIFHIEDCDERYRGFYHNVAQFAEELFVDEYIPEGIVVDWEQTWESNLRYDYTACSDGTSYRPIHIFSNN
jgi:hypothetical protein